MMYTKMLEKVMEPDNNVSDLCVCIVSLDTIYALSFIEFETDNLMGVYYTTEDNIEKFVVLNKEHITSVEIVYEQDIRKALDAEEDEDSMYQ